jgi:hypothetical protein
MGILNKLFGKKQPQVPQQALIVTTVVPIDTLDTLYALEDKLTEAFANKDDGEFDGHDVAVDLSHAILYMYGNSADRLLTIAEPILKLDSISKGATCLRRYGPADDPKSLEVNTTI